MRTFSSNDFYRFHTENLREIESAMRHVARDLHSAIARSHRRVVSAYLRLSALLLGAWAECRLQKLMYEPSGFTDRDRASIRSAESQVDRWTTAINLAFRRQYQIPTGPLQPPQLPHTAHYRYTGIMDALETHLRPVIALRNKMAHGQWVYTLTNDERGISVDQMRAVRAENSLTLALKNNLLRHLADAIHDLTVSSRTFSRDFDDHFRALESARMDLQNRSYRKYETQIKERYARGRQKSRTSC